MVNGVAYGCTKCKIFHSDDALGCRVSVRRAVQRGRSPDRRGPRPGVRSDATMRDGRMGRSRSAVRGDRGPDVSGPTVVWLFHLRLSPRVDSPPHAAPSCVHGACRRCPVEPRKTRACAVRRVTVTRVARPTVRGCAGCVRTARVRARCSRHRAAPRSRSHPPMTANTLATESLHQTNAFCDGIL